MLLVCDSLWISKVSVLQSCRLIRSSKTPSFFHRRNISSPFLFDSLAIRCTELRAPVLYVRATSRHWMYDTKQPPLSGSGPPTSATSIS